MDGQRLLADNDALDAARHFAAGESFTIHVGLTPDVRHHVVLRADFDGAEPYRGYHFKVTGRKAILVSTREGVAILDARLFERPVARLEMRPTYQWSVSGPIALYDD
jgi:hypothetical protein